MWKRELRKKRNFVSMCTEVDFFMILFVRLLVLLKGQFKTRSYLINYFLFVKQVCSENSNKSTRELIKGRKHFKKRKYTCFTF